MENNTTPLPAPVCPNCSGHMILAMAHVPMQPWNSTYDPDTALARGTLFPDLDLPYVGRRES